MRYHKEEFGFVETKVSHERAIANICQIQETVMLYKYSYQKFWKYKKRRGITFVMLLEITLDNYFKV